MTMALARQVIRRRDFRLLLGGEFAANLGSNTVAVAMALYITERTGSATDLSLILAAQSGALVVFLLFGGVWADRLNRKHLMITTNVIRGVLHALLAVLILTGAPPIWLIALIEALWGTAWAFFQPAYTGLLPATVAEDEIRQAQSLIAGSFNLTLLAGPAIASVVVLSIGAGVAFAIDAGTFAVSALLLAGMHPRERVARPTVLLAGDAPAGAVHHSAEAPTSVLHELRVGFQEVRSRTWVWATILAFSVILMCFLATWNALGPEVIRRNYGSLGLYGWVQVASGVGAVLGSMLGTLWHPRRPLATSLKLVVMWPATGLVAALGMPRGFLVGWVLIEGINGAMFGIAWETALATHIPPQALSRVSSYDWMGSVGMLPIGYALAGPLAGAFGARWVMGAGGVIGMLAVLLALIPRSTRELSARPVEVEVEGGARS